MGRFSILLLLSISFSAFSEDFPESEYPDSYFQNKIVRYQKLEIGGAVLMAVGIVGTIVGGAMAASAGTTSYQVNYADVRRSETGSIVGGIGGMIAVFAIPITAGGIVLKTSSPPKRLEAINVLLHRQRSLKFILGRNRLSLAYTF